MVAARRLLAEPPVRWLTAPPLWTETQQSDDPVATQRPALLRFDSDTFMEDFITVAQTMPERLGEWRVRKETWRLPAPTASATGFPLLPDEEPAELEAEHLKLYQSAHQRFYLVTASLVCRIPGLPDKMLDFSKSEEVSFVMRRMMCDDPAQPLDADTNPLVEYALMAGGWQRVPDPSEQVMPGEERFGLFPVSYGEFDGHQRRIFGGVLPVSARERLMNAGRDSASTLISGETSGAVTAEERIDQLLTVLDIDVLSPWRALNQQVSKTIDDGDTIYGLAKRTIRTSLAETNAAGDLSALRISTLKQRDQFQLSSWYTLLDFADFLKRHLNPVWQVIEGEATRSTLEPQQRQLYDKLNSASEAVYKPGNSSVVIPDVNRQAYYFGLIEGSASTVFATRLVAALKAVTAIQPKDIPSFLETTTLTYDTTARDYPQPGAVWPTTKFLLCGVRVRALVDQLDDREDANGNRIDGLIRLALEETLETVPDAPVQRIPLVPLARQISDTIGDSDYADDLYRVRCVYERPNCPPGVRPAVVSPPTETFQLASYFDPDAPARPFRIPMPVDTTPAGLRKFAKNTMFVLSDTLACQVDAARKLSFGDLVLSVLPWPFHKDLPDVSVGECKTGSLDIGMLCTLSIPIITICALILLIIIVLLLDIVFKWVPYLIFCLPLPGLKAKE